MRVTDGGPLATLYSAGVARCSATDATVRERTDKGVTVERYDGMPRDEYRVIHDNGPTIAWLTDPSGNVLSISAES